MALKDITREAVLAAMAEYDSLGKEEFLSTYGFSDAKRYYVEHDGRSYESKAIAGVAHRHLGNGSSPILPSASFTGGQATVVKKLRSLGFEVPDAPRNGPWTREELILALELYMRSRASPPGKKSAEVAQLSKVLDALGSLTGATKTSTFRNENGVYMKMMNFRRFDPAFAGQGKVGMTRGNRLEKEVWDTYSGDLPALREAASAIRAAVGNPRLRAKLQEMAGTDGYEAEEGGFTHRLHRAYERDRSLVELKKQRTLAETGALKCEACSFDFAAVYGPHGAGFIEVHHRRPVFQMKPGEKTRLDDLALLCSNCHRMAHRTRETMTVAEIASLVAASRE